MYMTECRNWGTEHYNCVLEITVSFLGMHKWEPDIYIGFSSALHLQCATLSFLVLLCQPWPTHPSSLGRYVFGSEISYNKAPPRLPGLGC